MTNTNDEVAINKTLDQWKAALLAKDSNAAMRCFGKDVVAFGLAPPLQEDVSREGFDSWFATWKGGIDVQITQQRINVGGDTAYVVSIDQISGTKVNGEKTSLWARSTRALVRINGDWRIVHEHTSVPFYMDGSLKAAVDLMP